MVSTFSWNHILPIFYKNISTDTQEMRQSRSTAFPRHKKERWGTNKDLTNSTYEVTDAQTKMNYNRTLDWMGGEGFKPVVCERCLTLLILMHIIITNICLLHTLKQRQKNIPTDTSAQWRFRSARDECTYSLVGNAVPWLKWLLLWNNSTCNYKPKTPYDVQLRPNATKLFATNQAILDTLTGNTRKCF